MIYLSAEKLSKNFPEQPLFSDLTFGIYKGEKIGLIANNGSGKSSLIRILAGFDEPDAGKIHLTEGIALGILEQEPEFAEGSSVRQVIEQAHHEIRHLIAEYHSLLSEHDSSAFGTQRLADLSAQMEVKMPDYDRDLKSFLTQFQITDLDQPASSLSGGQRKRVALAMTLSVKPDLIILDEPTNHLDIEMIEWLENYLASASVTLLMVTHDRYFLDKICNQILELHNGKLYKHQGNYAFFLEKKAEREMVFDREIEKTKSMLKQELEWMRRTPQARTTKAKSRIDAFYGLEEKANSRTVNPNLSLSIKMNRVGGKILELKNISKGFDGRTLLKNFTYTFKNGDRVGIVGPNGSGKTTLLNLIVGNLPSDAGQINRGETMVFGHYTQSGIELNDEDRIIDFIKNIAEFITLSNGVKLSASQFLQHFMFAPEMQYKPIAKLSGGERRRLHLMTVLIRNPNFLILDEPTNDLDLLTLNKLEEFLEAFSGCLVLVSHDRYFMDKLVDHLFIFEEGGTIKDFNGTYTEYRLQKLEESNESDYLTTTVKKSEKPSNKERNEIRKLERDIEDLEVRKKNVEINLSKSEITLDQIQTWSEEIGKLVTEIDTKTSRWMELVEMS
ncbi:MAG: ABC-F family ATP-binding cassette domain-containing protein [Saprospiraceae bacterium]|nr:ABC-F family ATP-binding cassette domain-containing protein [Saprospiraceae bacterium]